MHRVRQILLHLTEHSSVETTFQLKSSIISGHGKGKVVIIGSGIVGQSWALIFARGGYEVHLYDLKSSQCKIAIKGIKDQLEKLAPFQLLNGQSVATIFSRIHINPSLSDALLGAIYAQECCPEDVSIKKSVFQTVNEILDQQDDSSIIVASSSSNLCSSKYASALSHRKQYLVSHPVNPPFAIPVVEIVPAPWTSKEVVSKTLDILSGVKMKPVLLKKEIDGFLINRLQYALLYECYRLVEDGVASPEDVDTAIRDGLALRWSFMGPFQTIDLNAPKGVKDYYERYHSSIERVVKTQDNNQLLKKEVFDQIDAAIRNETPLHCIPQRLAWRNARLVDLAVHKANAYMSDKRSFSVPSSDVNFGRLNTPPLKQFKDMIKIALKDNFQFVETRVVKCPDLRQWGMIEPGLNGGNRLIDVGGVPNLFDPRYNDIKFEINDIAKKIDLPGAYIFGPCAAHHRVVGTLAETMGVWHTGKDINYSRYAKVLPDGSMHLGKYHAKYFGLLGNLYASRGLPGDVIEVRAKIRTGEKNFVTCLREGLMAQVGQTPEKQVGLGGVFRVVKGKVKAHVMPDFKGKLMIDGPEVHDWLKFYECDAGMTTLMTLLTGDPTKKDGNPGMDLRTEHAHFFNDALGQGGHYHYDTTPKEVEYLAYLTPAMHIYRISNAFKRL